jgi:hypothetical protein
MSIFHHQADDPFAGLTRAERRSWRRVERQIATAHVAELAVQLKALRGAPIINVETTPLGIVTVTVPAWRMALADVATTASDRLVLLACAPCHILGGARYGKFWWISAARSGDRRETAVILGSRLLLVPIPGGDRAPNAAGWSPVCSGA